MFTYQRKSTAGNSVPSWLARPGPVYVRKHACGSKYDSLVEQAELIEANPEYAFIRLRSGHETTVSLRDLAPCSNEESTTDNPEEVGLSTKQSDTIDAVVGEEAVREDSNIPSSPSNEDGEPPSVLRRSTRLKNEPEHFAHSVYSGCISR